MKLFILSLNLFVIFISKIYFGGDVQITQNMDSNIKPGDSTDVELVITKGDREGFAKWTQTLPQGFIATNIDTDGATFSFKNQEIKIIWMALPKEETFSIKYRLITNTSVSGDHNLVGRFSFIEESERKDVNSEVFILTVDENAVTEQVNTSTEKEITEANEVTPEDSTVADKIEETTLDNNKSDNENEIESIIPEPSETESKELVEPGVQTIATNSDLVQINRTIQHIKDGNYEVTLSINKDNLNSFAKVEEYLPPNYSATAIENNSGIFSFTKNVMKVMWMTIPKEENVVVKYQITSLSEELDSNTIHGVFSYLYEDDSKQVKMKPTKFRNYLVEQEVLADKEEPTTEVNEEDNSELANNSDSDNEADLTDSFEATDENSTEINSNELIDNSTPTANSINESSTTEEELIEEITNIPSPETNINYKVQIAASHKEVNQQYFVSRHNINEKVNIEYIDEWYKYTVGAFDVYKDARDKRNEIWAAPNKINDAFVTAYNAGERISVQEALMVSKQKWFK